MIKSVLKTPRWVRVLFVCSLALNLLFVGLATGAIVFGKDRMQAVADRAGPVMLRGLSREDRRALGAKVRRTNQSRGLGREASQQARADVVAALRKRPFDPEGLAQALQAQMALDMQRRDIGLDLMVERMTTLTDAQREDIAADMEKPRRKADRDQRNPHEG